MAKKAGIKVWAYFMLGLPGDNHKTIEQTIRFAGSLPADLVNFAVTTPYPGTDLYARAMKQGWLESEDWEDYDQDYSAILSYPDFSSEDILPLAFCLYSFW